MPTWVRGNQVHTASKTGWDVQTGGNQIDLGLFLAQEFAGGSANFMMQPGVLRGLNVFISTNGSSTDLNVQFVKKVYDGGTGHGSEIIFTLFTIPAGETGHFCAPKITSELADRSWARFDITGIRLKRSLNLGNIRRWTIATLVEITEETLLDTQQPPNRAIQG